MGNIFGRALASMCARGVLGWLPDKQYLQLYYFGLFGKWIDFNAPKTFNEKLQWLKLYDRKDIYTTMVDKDLAKKYVADIIGDEYIIPTFGVWDKFDDIDFESLPDRFVLKTTHDSGGVCICKGKDIFDFEQARKKMTASLKNDFYRIGREWPYKNVKHRIIAEEYIEANGHLDDYKFFCFNGKVKFFKIDFDRHTNHRANYFDDKCHLLEIEEVNYPRDPDRNLYIPPNIGKMIQLAEQLSKRNSFLRVDFYNVKGKIYFGELTFFPASGFGEFGPSDADKEIGAYLSLPI